MSRGLAAVSFDLDYTIAVPDRGRERLLREATAAVDAPSVSREAYLEAHAENLTAETRAPAFAALVDDPDLAEALAAAYRERVTASLELVPGVASLLDDLRERHRVALLTNGPRVAQREKVAALGLADRVDEVLVSGDLPAGKPDPRAFRELCDAVDAPPARVVHVGDDPEADVGGARDAGLRAVQVLADDGHGDAPDPRADAHVSRSTLSTALPGVLDGL
ncbi:MAG: HAD family hydrolase [Haloferacaceae archaeon]